VDPKQDEIKIMKPGKRRWIFYAIAGLFGGLVWIGLFLVFSYLHQIKKEEINHEE
jgi:hypothetical protein